MAPQQVFENDPKGWLSVSIDKQAAPGYGITMQGHWHDCHSLGTSLHKPAIRVQVMRNSEGLFWRVIDKRANKVYSKTGPVEDGLEALKQLRDAL
ncbi:hypothetical protein FOMPIDRAFT_1053841 [Fomitopsis schrenkii]|uniref:Uncharacterized protein n=1 Tax=Fomitopsis schrenkii TaxID=2126942 RepID=S8F245_FOMSC|nr:hypothetical protein FOMPIDRAFT_1053841 [Fomitopsis schrenkii]